MIEIDVPGSGEKLNLEHLVLDFNGTLAVDGRLKPGVGEALRNLASHLQIHVVTAGTFGGVEEQMNGIPCLVKVLAGPGQTRQKAAYVAALGTDKTACIGNGRNDLEMLRVARLGIVVIQEEGASCQSLAVADVVCLDIVSALELLLHPLGLTATLRS